MKRWTTLAMGMLLAAGMQLSPAMASTMQTSSPPATATRSARMPYSPAMRRQMRGFEHLLQNPFNKSVFDIYMLPTMQAKLNLSSTQVSKLDQMKQDYLKQEQNRWKEIADKEASLRALFKSNSATPDKVKSLVMDIANLRAQQQLASYDTFVQMRGVLNQNQLSQWSSFKGRELRSYAMAHLTLQDAAQMMRLMHSSMPAYGMMGQGPSQSAMMRHGAMHNHQGGGSN